MAIDLILRWQGVPAPEYSRRFRTAAHIADFSPVLKDIAVLGIAPAVTRNFEEGGRPKWTPLSDATIRNKMRRGLRTAKTILVSSGVMRDTATDPTTYRIDNRSIVATPGPHYWIHHQTGTSKMPQRVLMNLQVADQRIIGGLFNKFIAEHMAANGLSVRGQHNVIGGGGNTGGL